MTDHVWVQDQIAAFLADGLDAAEAERFRNHVRDCGECAAAVDAARAFDAGLANLFAAARPGPLLEDRTVRALRAPKVVLPSPRRAAWKRRLAVGLAASVIAGAMGTGVTLIAANGGLPMPGEGWAKARASEAIPEAILDLTNGDKGLETEPQANQPLDRLDAVIVDKRESAGSVSGPANTRYFNKNYYHEYATPLVEDTNGVAVNGSPPVTYARPSDEVRLHMLGAEPKATAAPFGSNATTFGYGLAGAPADAAPANDVNGKLALRGFEPGAFFRQPVPAPQSGPAGGPGRGEAADKLNLSAKQSGAVGRGLAAGVTASSDYAPPALGLTSPAPVAGVAVQTPPAPPPAVADPQPARKIIIRSGEVEFVVESFDSSVATVTQLVTKIKGGYVGTVNSEKLPNGKVKGSVVVRVPPDTLDGLLLDLRKELGKGGELKGQKIGSSDVTKQYTDLESRLKAARAMEQRLLAIIKDGKGEIKQLLEAEKELGVWRTKIEEYEGELRYYANQAALSTLTITLAEKDIRVAAGITESERVQAGVEVEDVDKAFRDALAAVAEVKGRVTKSELKQLSAGQFTAVLFFEVAPDSSGPMRDRLRQLGRVARLEIDRVQTADGGPPVKDAKVTRGDATFQVQFYNLANVAPRETSVLQIATPDVAATFRTLREAVEKAKGRVVTAQVTEGEKQNVSAQFDFEVKRTEEAAVQAAVATAGDVVSKSVARAPESDNVTDTKVLFRTTLFSAARLRPRETATLTVEVADVEATSAVLTTLVTEAKGRVVDSQVTHERNGQMKAKLVYDVPLAAATGVVEKAKAAGVVRVQQSNRDPSATEGKFATARVDVTLSNTELIVPPDDGVWPKVRKGLSYSASALLSSLTWVIFGLCVVLPWMVVAYFGYKLLRRVTRPTPVAVTTASQAPTT